MNKLGIKFYGVGQLYLDDIPFNLNSIKHTKFRRGIKSKYKDFKYRVIDSNLFGIKLSIKKINNE